MQCLRSVAFAVCLAVPVFSEAATTAADELLGTVPASALGLVVVNRPADALAKARQLAGYFQLPVPDPPGIFDAWLHAKDGVDEPDCRAIAIVPSESADVPVLFVGVKDYARFVRQFGLAEPADGVSSLTHRGATFLARQVGRYAVLVMLEHRAALEQVGKGPAIAKELAGWQTWIAQNDLTIAISRRGAESISGILPIFGKRLAGIETILGVAKQSAFVGLGARAMEAGDVQVSLRLAAPPDGPIAKLLGQWPAMDEDFLKQLPAAPMDGALAGSFPGALAGTAMQSATLGMLAPSDASKIDPKQTEESSAILRQVVEGVRGFSVLSQTARQGDSNAFINLLTVFRTDSASAMLDRYEKCFNAMLEIRKKATGKPLGAVVKRTQFEGLPALEIAIDLSSLEQQLSVKRSKLLADMLGPDAEPSIWLVAADDRTVMGGYFRRDLLHRGIGVFRGTQPNLTSDPAVAGMAKKLPSGASLVGYWNPTGSLVSLKRRFASIDLFGKMPELPAMPLVGAAVTIAKADLQFVVIVPDGVWKGFGQLKTEFEKSRATTQPAKPSKKPVSPIHQSIAKALAWLAWHQSPDGHWSLRDYTGRCRNKSCTGPGELGAETEATAISLLALLGGGQTHDKKGRYRATVQTAVEWLVQKQKADGNLSDADASTPDAHSMAAFALCEGYGSTKDAAIRPAAQKAVRFLELSSASEKADSGVSAAPLDDLAPVCWKLLALKSAKAAGLDVDAEKSHALAEALKKRIDQSADASLPVERRDPQRMAVALLAQQCMASPGSNAETIDAVRCVMAHLSELKTGDLRYRFFASLAMQNAPKADRTVWNNAIAKAIVAEQCKESQSCAEGSWSSKIAPKDSWIRRKGRVMTTALNTLILEMPFRYLSVVGKATSVAKTGEAAR